MASPKRGPKRASKIDLSLPIHIRDQQLKSILANSMRRNLGLLSKVSDETGISRAVIYRLLREDEEFARECADIDEIVQDFGESALFRAVKKGNVQATIFLLKSKAKKRGYSEAIEIKHSGQINTQASARVEEALTKLPLEKQNELRDLLLSVEAAANERDQDPKPES